MKKNKIYFKRMIHSSSIKYPSISEATSGIKARMTLSSFWCRLPASSMLPNHRIDLSIIAARMCLEERSTTFIPAV